MKIDSKVSAFISHTYSQEASESIELITGGGSSRKYYRFYSEGSSYILAENSNIDENKTFIYFTDILNQVSHNVPKIKYISDDFSLYVQTDLGNETLMDLIKKNFESAEKYYYSVIKTLVKLQIKTDKIIDYAQTFSYQELNQTLILRDLFQFKFYFLNPLNIDFNQGKLIKDFNLFASQFNQLSPKGFVFRDLQSRNIMINNNEPFFIDYQGGLHGPIFYDLVSLIWQVKANLSIELKDKLYNYYLEELKKIDQNLVPIDCKRSYEYCILARLLQVLGAYGFRGLIEKKTHFLESISYALNTLKSIIDYSILQNYPELKRIIVILTEQQTLQRINKITKINE